jgi:hypothetical protein
MSAQSSHVYQKLKVRTQVVGLHGLSEPQKSLHLPEPFLPPVSTPPGVAGDMPKSPFVRLHLRSRAGE